jgi:hypothetical protein
MQPHLGKPQERQSCDLQPKTNARLPVVFSIICEAASGLKTVPELMERALDADTEEPPVTDADRRSQSIVLDSGLTESCGKERQIPIGRALKCA